MTTAVAPYQARYFASCCDMNMWTTIYDIRTPGRPPEVLRIWTCPICKTEKPARLVEYGSNLPEIDDSDDEDEEPSDD